LVVIIDDLGYELIKPNKSPKVFFEDIEGIFALAFGFGMKTLSENFISGVIIRLEKIVVPGNVLELDGTIMTADSVRLRSTKTHSYDGREIFTPNSKVLQSAVGTFTLDNRNYRVQTEF
jgi:potassium efflux system protein